MDRTFSISTLYTKLQNWMPVIKKMAGRKKLNRKKVQARVDIDTDKKLQELAVKLGYTYGKGGATGEMLDAIANEDLVLITKDTWDKISALQTAISKSS